MADLFTTPTPSSSNGKKKPRGRPFQRGADPRRKGTDLPKRKPGESCPLCEQEGKHPGILVERTGRLGPFLGCSEYPACRYTQDDKERAPSPTPAPAPAPAPAAPTPAGSLDLLVQQIARTAAAESVNETRVREIVDSAMTQHIANLPHLAPRSQSFTVQVNDLPPVQIEGVAHRALPRVLTLSRAGFNILLVGPAGAGKTYLGEQLAQALGRQFATVSCAPGLPESAFIGRMIPNLSDGTERYRPAPFVECYRNGGIFMADENDNADASTLLVLNSALANGHITLPSGERVARHPDFVFIGSANTYGHGQSREYVGRTQLDAAYLDRFIGATLTLDYDAELEQALCPEQEIRDAVRAIRDTTRRLKLRRIVSTRAVIAARKLVTQCGDKLPAALQAITEGWTAEDRRACGVAV